MEYAIELKSITKRFPGVVANDDISIAIRDGEIHAIAGENGAGKSTLMNIIFGLYKPDEGSIFVRGQEVKFDSPKDSIARKIGMVHQHFMLIPKLTVAENIIIGQETGSQFKVDRKLAAEQIKALSEKYGLRIDPNKKVHKLTVAEQQRVEILKILYREADIIIFDEPTAVLTPQEIDEFCEILLNLKSLGKTIIFISHKLAEVMKVADQITVIRLGKVVVTVDSAEIDIPRLTNYMIGREVNLSRVERSTQVSDEVILELDNVSYYAGSSVAKLKDISFSLRRGEILGIAGVDGNGQNELAELLVGLIKPDAGSMKYGTRDLCDMSIRDRKDNGIAIVPEDRHRDSMVLEYTVAENIVLGQHHHNEFCKNKLWLDKKAINAHAKEMIKDFDIRCASRFVSAGTLSGGNQQKIVLAREVYNRPEIFIAIQPTRGLDIGASEFVQRSLRKIRDNDKGVLLFSLELDEILSVCDRIAVMYKGEIAAIVDGATATHEQLGLLMLRGKDAPIDKQAIDKQSIDNQAGGEQK